jgi:phosphoribosyl 1,2-cyclic phosphate phosphodiesterase
MGLDDVRPFNFRQQGGIPIYAAEGTMAAIHRCFPYIFDNEKKESNVPKLDSRLIDERPFDIFGMEFRPVPILHGKQIIFGFRFGNSAYLTDHSAIPDTSMDLLQNLDVLFLDALRYKPHPTHSTVDQSIATVERLQARRAYFTHICHDLSHERAESQLPPNIRLAYDGLQIEVEEQA